MAAAAPIIYVNGFPGTGKLTICREILAILGEDTALLIDNHQLIDPVAARLPRSHPNYRPERKREREKAFRTYVEDPTTLWRIVIFTDCQANDPPGRATASEYLAAATRSTRPFIPIILTCTLAENMRRITSPERMASRTTKLTSPTLLRRMREDVVWMLGSREELVMDVSEMGPREAARRIVGWVDGVWGGRHC